MRRALVSVVVFGWLGSIGCGEKPPAVRSDGGSGESPAPAASASPATPAVEPPAYPADVSSLRLKRSIVVRYEPGENAKPIGTIAQDTRVRWTRVAMGPGCSRWVEIEPRGWICDRYLEPSKKAPFGVELPKLKDGELVPGTYAKVVAGGVTAFKSIQDIAKNKAARRLVAAIKVRHVGEETVGGKLYWKTTEGELIEYGKLSALTPSTFVGTRLAASGEPDAPTLPLAWAQGRRDTGVYVKLRNTPAGQVVKSFPPRTIVTVLEASGDGKWQHVRAGEKDGWIAAEDLHVARASEPPSLTGEQEKWFDVDLDEQVVIAYEGRRPVYATLVSSGSKKWPTAPGIYRIWIKFAETNMSGQMGDEDPYSVATVPWTMYFAKDLAFHTAYWHDKFGDNKSHGCINLSPRDARALYFWATPEVPAGWSMAYGIMEAPGAAVRIRSRAVPAPEWMGYAKRVYEARLAKLPPDVQAALTEVADVTAEVANQPQPPDAAPTPDTGPGPLAQNVVDAGVVD
jgi:hypothetical protein